VQHLLKMQSTLFMTSAAQSALAVQASGERTLAPPSQMLSRRRLASGGINPPKSPFTNVRVNDPSADSHEVDQTTQSETALAVAGPKVAVGFNDSQQAIPSRATAAVDFIGYGYSTNGGASFTDGGTIPNEPEFTNLGDPWLTSDRAGNMYFAMLTLDWINFNLDVGVAKSTDGGRTWSMAAPITRPPIEINYTADKDAIAAGPDPTARGRDDLYAAWDDFVFNIPAEEASTGLPVARSTNGGSTWAVTYVDTFPIDLSSCSIQGYIGAIPVVTSDGTLFVVAEKYVVDDPTCQGAEPQFSEWIFRSDDGGQTFAPGVKIADVTASAPDDLLKLGPGQYMRTREFPTVTMFRNGLYVAWNDGASGHSHIRLARSTDGGRTWSLSWATQGSGDEVQPALSGDNELHLLYYERNNDNTLDVFVGNSRTGNSFVTKRVSTESSPGVPTWPPFDPNSAFGYMGDYIANATDGEHQYFAWGDNRDRVTDFLWPNGRNDPDVFFANQ
jgi:hypothetical protein